MCKTVALRWSTTGTGAVGGCSTERCGEVFLFFPFMYFLLNVCYFLFFFLVRFYLWRRRRLLNIMLLSLGRDSRISLLRKGVHFLSLFLLLFFFLYINSLASSSGKEAFSKRTDAGRKTSRKIQEFPHTLQFNVLSTVKAQVPLLWTASLSPFILLFLSFFIHILLCP